MRFLLLFALLSPALAQPLQRNSVVLNVAAQQIVRSESQWQTSWGSFSRDLLNSRLLIISLYQLGGGDSLVQVKWYFIGRDYDKQQLFIYDSGETEGNIARGGIKLTPSSKQLILNREQTTTFGRRTTGQHPWGWAVFVTQKGNPIAETASVPELVKWTQNVLLNEPPPAPKTKRPVKFIPQALGQPK